MTDSLLDSLTSLSDAERTDLLAGLTDEEAAALLYDWNLWARPSQLEPIDPWRIWLILAGRGYGKTRVGAEWVRKNAREFEYVNIAGATADDARDIMIEGESGIMAVCPAWERPEYRRSLRRLDWPSGAKSLIFTADEPERFRGKQHERFWADELAAWRYPEAWDQAILGLRLGSDPRALITTTPKPTRLLRDLIADPACAVTKGSTYENRDNLAPGFFQELIGKYEGTRLGRQELNAELLLDEGLAYRFSQAIHVVPAFDPPATWERFESMDFGSRNPTAWLAYAVDYDGNLIVFDEFYEPGLPSETAPVIFERRKEWASSVCYADPTVYDNKSVTNRWGRPATVADEFAEYGIGLNRGNNDRIAGHVRIAELLRVHADRKRPEWAGPGEGSPSMFIADRCTHLIEQLLDAPVEEEGEPHPGECVSRRWEGPHGHAHAALRYGVLSWPAQSEKPYEPLDDDRAEWLRKYGDRVEKPKRTPRDYQL